MASTPEEKHVEISNLSLYWGSFSGTLVGMLIATVAAIYPLTQMSFGEGVRLSQSQEFAFVVVCIITVINCFRHFLRRNIEPYQKNEAARYADSPLQLKIALFVLYTVIVGGYGITVALFGLKVTYIIVVLSLIQSLAAVIAWLITGYAKLFTYERGSYEQKSVIIILGDIFFLLIFAALCFGPIVTNGSNLGGDGLWFFLVFSLIFFLLEFSIVYWRELKRLGKLTFAK